MCNGQHRHYQQVGADKNGIINVEYNEFNVK